MTFSACRLRKDLCQGLYSVAIHSVSQLLPRQADLLGDRIGILAEGELQCCGSSLFLKNRFGTGYRLTCARIMEAGADAKQIEMLLQTHVPTAALLTDVGAEMTFQLPSDVVTDFPAMLRSLDEQKASLGVEHYGMTQVTMEEVFLKVGQSAAGAAGDHGDHDPAAAATQPTDLSTVRGTAITELAKHQIFAVHFQALMIKRARHGMRDWCSLFCSTMLPTLMLCLSLWGIGAGRDSTQPPLVMDAHTQFAEYTDGDPSVPYNITAKTWSSNYFSLPELHPQPQQLPAPPTFYFGHHYCGGMPVDCGSEDPNTCTCDPQHPPGWDSPQDYGNSGGLEPNTTLSMMKRLVDMGGTHERTEGAIWGALLFPKNQNIESFIKHGYMAPTILYNTAAKHAVPTYTNAFSNLLRNLMASESSSKNFSSNVGAGKITVRSEPFANTVQQQQESDLGWYILYAIVLMIAFAFVPSAVVAFPVMEAEAHHNSRHQQYISGVSIPAYWIANFCWDMAVYLVLFIMCFIALEAFQVKVFVDSDCADSLVGGMFGICGNLKDPKADLGLGGCSGLDCCSVDLADVPSFHVQNNQRVATGSLVSSLCPQTCNACGTGPLPALLNLFFAYGLSVIPATYFLSFAFKKHTSAQLFTLLINILTGMVMVLTSFILKVIYLTSGSESVGNWIDRLQPIFRMCPAFGLGNGIFNIATKQINDVLALTPKDDSGLQPRIPGPSLMQWDVAGGNIAALYGLAVFYFALTLLCDYMKNFPAVRDKISFLRDVEVPEVVDYVADPDVAAEEARVLMRPIPSGTAEDDVIDVRSLRKVYGSGAKIKVAVRSLTMGLSRGECFGFLGINGAGKTSTLNILTGAQLPTSGDAWLGSKNILTEQADVRRLIGYCPQHDALLDLLTVREHLEMFGRIKGVDKGALEQFVQEMMGSLDLKAHEHRRAKQLSGGNKRKLSVGIALIGSPALVSAGMSAFPLA
jgi:ABC-type lipoprotein export system ATPase subunit